ncbi:MAG: SMC-Scp complex subunit ScpB [Alphaproteobacteria bacterium]|nr:SMC-Scp complex subunit ScpB [Alphaproteobacteria bacterium]
MSVRSAQATLAERLGVGSDDDHDNDGPSRDDDPEREGGGGSDRDRTDPSELQSRSPVYDAAQQAEHVRLVEALLFASSEPVTASLIAKRLPVGADVVGALNALQQRYEGRGVVVQNAGGRYRFITNPDVAYILTEERVETRKLSRAAMETLAVIAYHQPCTRADIEDVRGVAVSKGSIDQLLEMGWIRLAGRRRDAPGRPVLYATTTEFLAHFDLEAIGDLPGMSDLKAAGLLDANLPPDFTIPMPSGSMDDEGNEVDEQESDSSDDPEFVQDFHDAEAQGRIHSEATDDENID